MTNRRAFLALSLSLAAFVAAPRLEAAMTEKFTTAAFEKAKAAGPVLVKVTAPWCPTCKAQAPILSELTGQAKFKQLTVLDVDFDSQKDVLKTLGVNMQSTLIVYSHGKEVGRSTGDTSKASIEALLSKSMAM
jgi:thioredoxin 1